VGMTRGEMIKYSHCSTIILDHNRQLACGVLKVFEVHMSFDGIKGCLTASSHVVLLRVLLLGRGQDHHLGGVSHGSRQPVTQRHA